ncbi:hypothetical protein [Sediminibacillus halophilus]|uniref:Phage protein n=1 Tax=Sediminibacillus halophilus TaxID=482461 RepID=A0A1G9QV42_9BACI|nr:hypothetical protein [Sediminibacillus halophilus]SDM14730.1 hypothetical protein SAMN05216244_1674 [Sediminibacillus halophilus]
MLDEIYQAMMADDFIVENAGGRIKYYEYPEAADLQEPHIVIDPLAPPSPEDFADNNWLKDDHLYQIEVWTKKRTLTDMLAKKIQSIMWKLGLAQVGGLPEYDKDYGIFRDARRYTGKKYRKDFDTL